MAEFKGVGATNRPRSALYHNGMSHRVIPDKIVLPTAGVTAADTIVLAKGISLRDTLSSLTIKATTATALVIDIGIRKADGTILDADCLADGLTVSAMLGNNILGTSVSGFDASKNLGEHAGKANDYHVAEGVEIYATVKTKNSADGSLLYEAKLASTTAGDGT